MGKKLKPWGKQKPPVAKKPEGTLLFDIETATSNTLTVGPSDKMATVLTWEGMQVVKINDLPFQSGMTLHNNDVIQVAGGHKMIVTGMEPDYGTIDGVPVKAGDTVMLKKEDIFSMPYGGKPVDMKGKNPYAYITDDISSYDAMMMTPEEFQKYKAEVAKKIDGTFKFKTPPKQEGKKMVPDGYTQVDMDQIDKILKKTTIPWGTGPTHEIAKGVMYDLTSGKITVTVPECKMVEKKALLEDHDVGDIWYDVVQQAFYVKTEEKKAAELSTDYALAKEMTPEATLASFRVKKPGEGGTVPVVAAAQPSNPCSEMLLTSYTSSEAGTVGGGHCIPPGTVMVSLKTSEYEQNVLLNVSPVGCDFSSLAHETLDMILTKMGLK